MANLMKRNRNPANEMERSSGGGLFDPLDVMRSMMGFDPFAELPRLARDGANYLVPFDVKETKDAWLFKADVPGVKEEDLDISLTGNVLTVCGKRSHEEKKEGETWHSYERSYGAFSRSFTLPDNADGEAVKAELRNGELLLNVPKRPEMQPKRIAIGSSGPSAKEVKDVKH